MSKIKKNLSDLEMLAGWVEKDTFETAMYKDEPSAAKAKPAAKTEKNKEKEGDPSFFSPDLQEKVSKALLEIKVDLFHQGIVDYDLKVSRQKNQVILTAVPRPPKEEKPAAAGTAGSGKKPGLR